MKKIAYLVVLLFALGFVFQGKLFAAEKMASVDLEKLFSDYKKTKDFDKALQTKQDSFEAEANKKLDEIKKLQADYSTLSDKEKDKKRSELEDKARAFEDFKREKSKILLEERDEKLKEVLKDIESTVTKIAQKEGYTIVFNDRVFVYADKALDITSKVSAQLEQGGSSGTTKNR
ncbi:MAG: OmpH family outer membrane protein [Candidatus Omnitrophota bacterium]